MITPDIVSTDGKASPAMMLTTVIAALDDPRARIIQSSKSPDLCRSAGRVDPVLMIINGFIEVVIDDKGVNKLENLSVSAP